MHKLFRCLVSLALVFSLSCVSLTASAVNVEGEDSSTLSIVAKEGSVLNWDAFDIGSSRVGSTYTIPAGNYTFKGVPSGEGQNFDIGGGRLSDWGEGLSEPGGASMEATTMTLSMGLWDFHTSLSGTFRFTCYMGNSPGASNAVYWLNPSEILCQVIGSNGVVAEQYLTSKGDSDWAVDLSWSEKKIQQVKLTITFPNFSKTSTKTSWYRYIGLGVATTVRWDGATTESESVDGILEGVNQGNELQAQSNGLLSGIIELITSLPEAIGDAIKGLFIPDESQIDILRGKWQDFLTTKMGFIYQMFQWVDTFFNGIIDNLTGTDTGAFEIPAFPAFEAGGETVQLWSEPLTVDFSDNAFVQTLQPIACPFILGVTAYHLWFAMSDLMECFFAGKSYRDYHEGRKEE